MVRVPVVRSVVAGVAAGMVTLALLTFGLSSATAASEQVCTDPEFTFTGQGGQGMGRYFADAGWWATGGHDYRQTMGVCSTSSWYVDVSVPDHEDRAVLAYPNMHYDWVTDWSTMAGMRRLDLFSSLKSDFAHVTPEGGVWNVAYDIWLNGVGNGDGTTELMVWTENSGQRPAGTNRGVVTVDGRQWELWTTRETPSEDAFTIITYKAVNTVRSGTLDVLALTDHLRSTGRLKAGSVIGQLDYGVEIVQTGGAWKHFDFTNFNVRATDGSPRPTPDPTTPTPDPTTPTPDPTDEPGNGVKVAAGQVKITPVAKTPTRVHVTFPAGRFTSPPVVQTTPVTSVPGRRVLETSVLNVTKDGCDVLIYRTNTVRTTVGWTAIQP